MAQVLFPSGYDFENRCSLKDATEDITTLSRRLGEDFGLRNQFEIVVGSLESILAELRGVADDLKVVVNQIDDVTNQIEASQTSGIATQVNQSKTSAKSETDQESEKQTRLTRQRTSLDSGIQDLASLHDYVNIDKLGLELPLRLRDKVRTSGKRSNEPDQTSHSSFKNIQHFYQQQKADYRGDIGCDYPTSSSAELSVSRTKTKSLDCGDKWLANSAPIDNGRPCTSDNNKTTTTTTTTTTKDIGPTTSHGDLFTRIVKKKKRNTDHSRSSISISQHHQDKMTELHKTGGGSGALHKSKTAPCVTNYCNTGTRADSVSDIYERRFEEQLESFDTSDSIKTFNNPFYSKRGWSSSSAISDPVDLSEHLLELVHFDNDDTAYESDDNKSDASTISKVVGMKSSNTFKYKLRQQLAMPRNQTAVPSWRVVIEP